MASKSPAFANRTQISASDADADRLHGSFRAQPLERAISTVHRFAEPRLECICAVGENIHVMNEHHVNPVGAHPEKRLLKRAHGSIIRVVDNGLVGQAAGKSGSGRTFRDGRSAWASGIHISSHLRREHDPVPAHHPQCRPAAMFGQAVSIVRGCVKKGQPCPQAIGDRRNGDLLIQLGEEVTERRGAEA
jgi:hypothetical protein